MNVTKKKLDSFSRQIRAAEARIGALNDRAGAGVPLHQDILPAAFDDLQESIEELHVAEEELRVQNEQLQLSQMQLECERNRFQELFDFAPDAYLETDALGIIRNANTAAAELFGIEKRFIVPKPLTVFLASAQSRSLDAFLSSFLTKGADGAVREHEALFRSRCGREFYAWMRVAAVRNLKGEVSGLGWVVRDITDRKETERRIREIYESLEQRVRERTTELVHTQEVLLAANRLKDEVLLRESLAREEAEDSRDRLAFLSDAGLLLSQSLDYPAILADVARLAIPRLADWCMIDIRGEQGQIRRMVVHHSDPAKAATAEELLEFPPDVRVDRGATRVINSGATLLFGTVHDVEEIAAGTEPRRMELLKQMAVESYLSVPLIVRDHCIGAISLARDSHERGFEQADGSLAEELARRAALAVDNALLHRQANEEIMERRRAEVERDMNHSRVQALNERLRRSIRESNHRIKNNLQIIAAMIDLKLMESTERVDYADLRRVVNSIRALAAVHDLLTQDSTGDESPTISARELLERLVPLIRQAVGGREIQLEIEDARIPGRMTTALCLLVNELVSNALKHSRGYVRIDFRVEDGTACLQVLDDGSGFPEGFDPTRHARTGIELVESLTRWDLGGTTSYENRQEGGAAVKVWIPEVRSS